MFYYLADEQNDFFFALPSQSGMTWCYLMETSRSGE